MEAIKKSWYKRWWGIVIIILLSLVLIFFVIFGLYILDIALNSQLNNTDQNLETQVDLSVILGGNHNYWTGSNKPIITIVEFDDYACPFCTPKGF